MILELEAFADFPVPPSIGNEAPAITPLILSLFRPRVAAADSLSTDELTCFVAGAVLAGVVVAYLQCSAQPLSSTQCFIARGSNC